MLLLQKSSTGLKVRETSHHLIIVISLTLLSSKALWFLEVLFSDQGLVWGLRKFLSSFLEVPEICSLLSGSLADRLCSSQNPRISDALSLPSLRSLVGGCWLLVHVYGLSERVSIEVS